MAELWAARDRDGTVMVYYVEPFCDGCEFELAPLSDLVEVDGATLTDLQPGEKCRVELRRIEETDRAE